MSGSNGSGGTIGSATIKITPDPGFTLAFDHFKASEELGRPFKFELDLSSSAAKADLTSMLGTSATLTIKKPDGSTRYFNGIIARMAYDGLIGGGHRYRMELRPWIWLLSQTQTCQMFQNQKIWDIVTKIFRDGGFSDFSDKRQNQAGDQTVEYCVQYNETSLDFVTRLMEKYGLYYYFTHADGVHTMVLADDPNSHSALAKAIPFRFDETESRQVDDHIWEWSSDLRLQPGAVTLRDYNFTTPSADLTAKAIQAGGHPHGDMEIYEFPGPYGTVADGRKLADVRLQNAGSQRQIVRAATNARGISAGTKFTLSDFTDAQQNREYLVISAEYSMGAVAHGPTQQGEVADTFECSFRAVPGTTQVRLDGATPWPVMRGPQTAQVVGQAGQEITTDQYGRVKVRFFWDRTDTTDENASCWIRVAQTWAGTGWGAMVIPRIGQEVLVDFLDGNPDRPIITGCVYNATTTVPYPLPGNKTRSTFKTNSSPGGSGFNELRFEDKAGSEEVFFQAQKDYNKVVLHNETVKITQDTTTTVEQGNHSITVSQGNDSLTVSAGNHTITVSAGSSTISAGQSITLKVGANSIAIDTTGITINGTQVQLKASAQMTADGGASMTLKAGMIAIN